MAAQDFIYATIRNIGSASDGRGHAIYEPGSAGQVQALRNALAGIDPTSITLLEGHGTGTRVGDDIELQALHEVFTHSEQKNGAPRLSQVTDWPHQSRCRHRGHHQSHPCLASQNFAPSINCTTPHPLLTADNSPFYLNTDSRTWQANPHHPRPCRGKFVWFRWQQLSLCAGRRALCHTINHLVPDWPNQAADNFSTITINGATLKTLTCCLKTPIIPPA